MGTLLGEFVRRQLGLIVIGAVAVVLFLGSFVVLGEAAYGVWALLIIGVIVLVQLRQGPGGRDARLDAEDAAARAEIIRGAGDGLNAMQRGRLEAIAIAEAFGTTSADVIARERAAILRDGAK